MALIRDIVMNVPSSYSNFDISQRNRLDIKPGLLYPVFTEEVLPRDSFTIYPNARIWTPPALAPLMSSHTASIDFFFVPTRLYVQSMDINRIQFAPSETKFPTIPVQFGTRYNPLNGFASTTSRPTSAYLPGVALNTLVGLPLDSPNIQRPVLDGVSAGHGAYYTIPDVKTPYLAEELPAAVKQLETALESRLSPFFARHLQSYLGMQSPTSRLFVQYSEGTSASNQAADYLDSARGTLPSLNTGVLSQLDKGVFYKNACPTLGYYDIFRTFYANTQEELFFMNSYSISEEYITRNMGTGTLPGSISIQNFYSEIISKLSIANDPEIQAPFAYWPANEVKPFTTWSARKLSALDDFISSVVSASASNNAGDVTSLQGLDTHWNAAFLYNSTRTDEISKRKYWDAVPIAPWGVLPIDPLVSDYFINGTETFGHFAEHGLVARTYSPDQNNVWLNQDTYGQMLQSSSMNVENGQLTVQQIRTASKLLQYDERGLVAGGRYSDWVYAEFGVKPLKDLCVPLFIGRSKSRIVFDDLYATNAPEGGAPAAGQQTTLGQLGGKGFGSIESSRPIRFSSDEHGYIIGLLSIVPEVSYSSGYKDLYDKTELGDLYAPVLARIGFQPRMLTNAISGRFNYYAPAPTNDYSVAVMQNDYTYGKPLVGNFSSKGLALGYQPAWTEYMTALDRANGSFVRGGELDYWVLTRDYSLSAPGIATFFDLTTPLTTTYVLPWQYQYPFADQGVFSTNNFYVQMSFDAMVRRQLSKTVMPTLS